jgi:very-short-patch-repair endonuclease
MSTPSRHELLQLAVHDVITGSVLRAHGFRKAQRRTLLRREHLFPAHRDVFFTTDRPSRRGVWLAAVTHCGRGALLGCESAAALRGLIETDGGRPHVMVPAHRITKPPAAIRVHRSRTLRDQDADEVDLIPVTGLFRTFDDLARRVNAPTLKAALREGERRYNLDLGALYDYATSRKLRRMLETYVPGQGRTDSALEALFVEICAHSTLPPPERQRRSAGGRVDFLWPSLGLIVEVDGFDSHRGRIAFREDRARDRRNQREGKETLRFTHGDLTQAPHEVVADLNAAHTRLVSRRGRHIDP